MLSKKVETALFLVILTSLFLQLAFIERGNEPYPAVLLPGAGGKQFNKEKNQITYTEFVIEAYSFDQKKEVDVDQFLGTVPRHYRARILQNYLGLPFGAKSKDVDITSYSRARLWIKKRLLTLTGFEYLSHIKVSYFLIKKDFKNLEQSERRPIYSFSLSL